MHANEVKLVKDMSKIVGINIYSLAKEVFETCGFSKQFIVTSITKDGTVSFGTKNKLHWNVVKGWVLDPTNDYYFSGKVLDALENKHNDIIENANV